MINRKVLYFYEYASEIRGKCLGHARILVCGQLLKLTLAFSLPEWEKKPCKLYFIAENSRGKVAISELGEIMPSAIMTVYNIDMEEVKLDDMRICDIVHACLFVKDSESRYIKAVTGIFDITNKSLHELLNGGVDKDEEDKKNEIEYQTGLLDKNTNYIEDNNTDKMFKEKNGQDEQCAECLKSQVERLMSMRPEYRPFNAGKISCSVRIGVGDVLRLSEVEPGLRENSFLLHGFYRYKHILLANSMQRGQINYYILVPGIRIEREQRIADMYGFHEFLTLDGQIPRAGVFGYYSWLLGSW